MEANGTDKEPVIRTIAMPSDTNPAGDIFGGWLMSQMDLAAGNAAARRARGRCVTVAVDGMVFHTPVHVGDEVSVHADLISTERTSMKFRVEAWRRSRDGDETDQGDLGGLHVRCHRQWLPSRAIAARLSPITYWPLVVRIGLIELFSATEKRVRSLVGS